MTLRIRRRGAEAFAERVASFTATVRLEGERTARFLERSSPPHDEPRADETLEELRAQHEELRVAEELLRTQLDELGRMGLALEAQRERYADLFEHAPDPFVVTDRATVIHDANEAATETLGVETRFLRGKPITTFIDLSDIRRLHDALDALERGARRFLELGVRPRRGPSVRMVAHFSLASRGHRVLWTFRPVVAPSLFREAPTRDLARALRDKEDLLARERRLREELDRANRAKDRFIAVLSHDLRAPLNAILGWTQLLRREVLDSGARNRAYETIERNAHTQAKLIDELLDISRIAADKVQLALTPIDLGALAQRAIERAIPRAAELGLTATINVEPGVTVIADRQRLEQILSNLVDNAMKFTPAGGSIHVTVRRDGNEALLVVRDTGHGISPNLLPHVFEMYTQERSYGAARTGLGLGLYIVRQLVELQDGSVRVESDESGKGTTFEVRFPRHDEVPTAPSELFVEPPVALADLRVLVVDDDEDARELMATILRRGGATVACASGVTEALTLIASWNADVVVSDLAMRGSDGLDLVRQLRERHPGVAALAVSGFTRDQDVERALAAGFDAHIGKPVQAAELIEAVHESSRLRHH